MQTFVLAGGCFWCLDAVYRSLKGVSDVLSGYAGGHTVDPTYESVCTGTTGHTETVQVTFDPEVIPAQVILDVYFTMHDPRQVGRQGNDIGPQYGSAMYYTNDEERAVFEAARDRAAGYWEGEIVTKILPLTAWYSAEDYHQDFYAKNPGQGYCMAVALPKVNKIRKHFAEYAMAS
jgi:methionine-S-sulfoxide reductase